MILSSPDGTAWKPEISGVASALTGVAFGQEKWVAVGSQGTILNSSDGKQWKPCGIARTDYFSAVTFAKGLFVAVGSTGTFGDAPGSAWVSSDGETWVPWRLNCIGCGPGALRDVVYSQDFQAFIAVGWGNAAASEDGINWHLLFDSPAGYGIASGNGILVCASDSGIYNAVRGYQWTPVSLGPYSISSVVFFNGTFIASATSKLDFNLTGLFRSSDGRVGTYRWVKHRPDFQVERQRQLGSWRG